MALFKCFAIAGRELIRQHRDVDGLNQEVWEPWLELTCTIKSINLMAHCACRLLPIFVPRPGSRPRKPRSHWKGSPSATTKHDLKRDLAMHRCSKGQSQLGHVGTGWQQSPLINNTTDQTFFIETPTMGFSDGLQGIDVAAAGTPLTNRGSNEFVVKDVEPGGTRS